MVFSCRKQRKNFQKILYFAFVIATLNMAKVDMFQISLMGDTEVCEPKE